MNIDTGHITMIDWEATDKELRKRLLEIEEGEMTPEQKRLMKVSLHDHRSGLGQKLTAIRRAERNKFTPHVGAKELSKIAARDLQNVKAEAFGTAPQDSNT